MRPRAAEVRRTRAIGIGLELSVATRGVFVPDVAGTGRAPSPDTVPGHVALIGDRLYRIALARREARSGAPRLRTARREARAAYARLRAFRDAGTDAAGASLSAHDRRRIDGAFRELAVTLSATFGYPHAARVALRVAELGETPEEAAGRVRAQDAAIAAGADPIWECEAPAGGAGPPPAVPRGTAGRATRPTLSAAGDPVGPSGRVPT